MRAVWLTLGFAALLVGSIGCGQNKKETPMFQAPATESPSQEGWNSKLELTYSGKLQTVIRYGHMAQYESSDRVLFDQNVEVDFYDKEGRHASNLKSLEGEYRQGKEDVLAKGNVVVVSDSGMVLKTEALRWENQREKIESDTTVCIITTNLDTLYGRGFESDSELKHWTIRQPWGVSEKRVEIEKFDAAFAEPAKPDTSAKQKLDSTTVTHSIPK